MKDHTVSCEIRTIGARTCTCGAPNESYPTVTTNGVTDVDVLAPRDTPVTPAPVAPKPVAAAKNDSKAVLLIKDEIETFSLMENNEAATVVRVLQRLLARIGG